MAVPADSRRCRGATHSDATEVSHFAVSMFMQAVTYAIAVLGMVVVLGYTGQINLAQAAFFGFGAYGVALGTVSYGLPFWFRSHGHRRRSDRRRILGLTTLRLGGHYLAMITISFQQIFDLVAVNWIAFTHGPDGIAGIPRPSLFGHELADDRAYLLLCTLILYGLIALVWWLPQTRLGRAMRACARTNWRRKLRACIRWVKVTHYLVRGARRYRRRAVRRRICLHQSGQLQFHPAVEFRPWCCSAARITVRGVLATTLLILLPECSRKCRRRCSSSRMSIWRSTA